MHGDVMNRYFKSCDVRSTPLWSITSRKEDWNDRKSLRLSFGVESLTECPSGSDAGCIRSDGTGH